MTTKSKSDALDLDSAIGRIKELEDALHNLLQATALHHRNIFDLDNRTFYNCAKLDAQELLGIDK